MVESVRSAAGFSEGRESRVLFGLEKEADSAVSKVVGREVRSEWTDERRGCRRNSGDCMSKVGVMFTSVVRTEIWVDRLVNIRGREIDT